MQANSSTYISKTELFGRQGSGAVSVSNIKCTLELFLYLTAVQEWLRSFRALIGVLQNNLTRTTASRKTSEQQISLFLHKIFLTHFKLELLTDLTHKIA